MNKMWKKYVLKVFFISVIACNRGTGQKTPGQKAPHNEIIIQSYYIFFILMVILKIS
jgi:hypothetical protein